MPGIDGFELCSKIRLQVDYPILFLTAKTDERDIIKFTCSRKNRRRKLRV